MKRKVIIICAITVGLGHYGYAQKQQTGSAPANTHAEVEFLSKDQRMTVIKNCPELFKQLSAKFGSNFSVDDPKVISLLKSNTTDKNVDPVIMKLSIYLTSHTKAN